MAHFCQFLVQKIKIQRIIIDDQDSVGHRKVDCRAEFGATSSYKIET